MTIRMATVADAAQIAAVHVQSWQGAYRGLLPDDFLANLSLERRKTGWESMLSDPANVVPVYELDSQIVGFVSYGRFLVNWLQRVPQLVCLASGASPTSQNQPVQQAKRAGQRRAQTSQ